MTADKHSKTEKPTAQKLRKAREEGQVARSAELGSWVCIAVAALVTPPYLRFTLNRVAEHFSYVSALPQRPGTSELAAAGQRVAADLALILALPLGLMMVLGIGASIAQTGFVFSPKAAKPKLSHLSWKQGVKKIVGKKAAWETLKQTTRLIVVAAVATPVVIWTATRLASPGLGLGAAFSLLVSRTVLLIQVVAVTGVLLSIADFAFQKRSRQRELMMTKQEVKQEAKNNDGDPLLKGKRRQLQAELSRNRMLATVSESTVVVVNPVHFAVALHYDGTGTPVVTARGAREHAIGIRDEALSAGVPVVECVPLARRLHKDGRRGHPIPAELFAAVAVLIAFTQRLGHRRALPVVHRLSPDSVSMSDSE